MIGKIQSWKTSTRHKFLAAGLIYIGICIIIILAGWLFYGRTDAASLILALSGPGSAWAGLVAASTAYEKKGKR